MKKITLLTTFLFSLVAISQTTQQKIQSYFDSNLSKLGVTKQDVSEWSIEGETSSSTTKITNYHVVQRHQGIEVFDTQSNVWFKEGRVVNMGNRFKSEISQKVNTTSPALNVLQAVSSAYDKLGMSNPNSFSILESKTNNKFLLSDGVKDDEITAKLVYQLTSDNKLKLAWAFQIHTPDGNHYWDLRIDASNGQILEKNDLTISCTFGKHNHATAKKGFNFEKNLFSSSNSSLVVTPATYKVIPYNYISPNHHAFELITTTGNALASPNGWHDSNAMGGTNAALKFTYSRGNNILAQEDANGDNGTGIRAEGGAALNFDFLYGGQTAVPTTYTSAATTNLFYMTNIMHDVWYQYGFDEVNGNFQQNNLGRGGVTSATGDYVQADSQDGYSQTTPTLDNANFTPTNDGVRPRIQMFLWTAGAPPTNYIQVNSPSSIAGPRPATTNVFEGTDRIPVPVSPNGITSDLVLYTNVPVNVGQSTNSACQAPTNPFDISGKIALIKRGGCFFSNKVKNAQDAGATAVIVMDSIPNNPVRLSMSSTGLLGITIPAVFITKEIGDELIAEMANGPVNVKLEVPTDLYLYADGDFDNGIIAHEYGHGISNRLVGGGLAGCMDNNEQMGEGWSDWFSLMMQLKAGDLSTNDVFIGTYAINQANDEPGIREFPYTTDMSKNPRTLNSSNAPNPDPLDPLDTAHRYVVGETWATILWDLTWTYIEKYGYDSDIYNGTGGNNKVMRLVLDALKLDTCDGTNIVTGRDNLFAADQATTNGADYCMIAEVFRRRGVGLNASSGSVADCNDQVEDFTAFPPGPNCTLAVDYFSTQDMVRVSPNPSNGIYNIRINKFVGKVAIQVVDINGRVVFNQTDDKFNIEKSIDLSNFQSGVYILKINGENLNYTEKLIKN